MNACANLGRCLHALDRFTDPADANGRKLLACRPRLVESAAEAHEPHRVASACDVATVWHGLWSKS